MLAWQRPRNCTEGEQSHLDVGSAVHTRDCCLCSRGMVGALSAETLDAKVDINGTTFKDASTRVGYGGASHEVLA